MMTTTYSARGGKLHYTQVYKRAIQILKALHPHCYRIAISGALRREVKFVDTIEILCVPKSQEERDLFNQVYQSGRSHEFISIVKSLGPNLGGSLQGNFTRRRLSTMLKVDIHICSMEDFYRQLAVTTGPKLYSELKLEEAWRSKGWVETEEGLRLVAECWFEKNSGPKKQDRWVRVTENPTLPPHWMSELEFFEWLGIDYTSPETRGK